MDIPTRIEVNCTTGEVTEHLLTAEEILQRQKDKIHADLERIAEEEKKAEKAVKRDKVLKKLNLTEEELELIRR